MSKRQISFEMLNGYVDGELSSTASAEVAQAVADDPALAREVAALSLLRSSTAESIEAPPLSLPEPKSAPRYRRAVAASIVFALLAAGSLLMWRNTENPGSAWQANAWQIHHGWSLESSVAAGPAEIAKISVVDTLPGAYVPDLSASQLTLVQIKTATLTPERRTLVAGFRGSRGCKISLLVFPSAGKLGEKLNQFRDGKSEAYGWRAGALSYLIVSDGMDPDRFGLLARSVRSASLHHVPFDERTRMALHDSREKSAPCAA